MTLDQFAAAHRATVAKDKCGTPQIRGKDGAILEYGSGRFAVTVEHSGPLTHASSTRWAARRRTCLAAGMEVSQDGDDEGACTFDPADKRQASAALKVAGAAKRRKASPGQLAALRRHAFTRKSPALEGRVRPVLPTIANKTAIGVRPPQRGAV